MKWLLALAAAGCMLSAQAEGPMDPSQFPPAPMPMEPAPLEPALPATEAQPALAEQPEASVLRDIGEGLASWYGPGLHGRRTANGERFDQHALTAAHRTLPFGTVVRVRSLVNGRTVDVRINDRGPVPKRRVIDLSRGAAAVLGLIESGAGVKRVALSLVRPGQ